MDSGAVGTDDADNPSGGQFKAQILNQKMIAKTLAQVDRLHHQVTKTRSGRNGDATGFGRLLVSLSDQFFIGLNAGT